jgi:ABC-type glycerol-3-phosphate transport system permease component
MIRKTLIHLLLLAGLAVVLFPFAWMISTSLKTKQEAQSNAHFFPAQPQFENYPEAWNGARAITAGRHTFGRFFVNSLGVALCVTAFVVVTSLLAGYAFACLRFPGRDILFGLFLGTMMVPFEVTLIPNFMTIRALDLYNTYAALIVPWMANVFSIFLVRQFMLGIPRDYFDAARIDGCGHLQFLFLVAAPMAAPALATVSLFAFLGSWNSFLWPLLVTDDPSKYVVQYGLALFVQEESTSFHLLMAASTMVIAPVAILYLLAQKHFVAGVSAVGLKG